MGMTVAVDGYSAKQPTKSDHPIVNCPTSSDT